MISDTLERYNHTPRLLMGFAFLCHLVTVSRGSYGSISIKVTNIKYNHLPTVGNNSMEYKLSEAWEAIIHTRPVN